MAKDYAKKFDREHWGMEMCYSMKPSSRDLEKVAKELKDSENLQNTDAGLKAQELDAADGKKDGKISASVWNKYAKEHGGKTVKTEISVVDAMNSITKYSVEEQIEAKKAEAKELKEAETEALKQEQEARADYEAGQIKEDIESSANGFGL